MEYTAVADGILYQGTVREENALVEGRTSNIKGTSNT